MTEDEYIKVSNKTALLCACNAMREVLPGKAWGVDEKTYSEAMKAIGCMRDILFLSLDGSTVESNEGGE